MSPSTEIRPLNAGEFKRFADVFQQAFSHSEGEAEGAALHKLVNYLLQTTPAADLRAFAAVASGDEIVGGVVYTRMWSEGSSVRVWLLSPMAILPSHQRQGLGRQLLRESLPLLPADLIMTYGDIRFYGRLGFQQVSEEVIRPPYPLQMPEGWLALSPNGDQWPVLANPLQCVESFRQPEIW